MPRGPDVEGLPLIPPDRAPGPPPGRPFPLSGKMPTPPPARPPAGTESAWAYTHLPRRAHDLPEPLWAAIDAADVVVHAGDWVDVGVLDAFEERATRLVGVYGNNAGPALRAVAAEQSTCPPCAALAMREARCTSGEAYSPANGSAQLLA